MNPPFAAAPRRLAIGFVVGIACLAFSAIAVQARESDPPTAAQREFFETKIRPVLAAQCYACHGAGKRQGGLRTDWRGGLLEGGDSGPALAPGEPPEESLLIRVLEHREDGLAMPKDRPRLPDATIRDFREWIATGAFDPRDKPPSVEESAAIEWRAKLAERRTWWSLQPLAKPAVPSPRDSSWSGRPIDRFLLARLEASGLRPAPPADRSTLARRLAFVITGLPLPGDDLRAFLADPRPDAYERLADRLLASPHYGERFARHWMDVVRYGDTYGYEWDIPAKGAWRYRDYLTRAFNADVPFDRLVREQIAGDLLPDPRVNEAERINESRIGPMFFQLGEKRHGDSAMFDGIHQEMLHNKIDAFSKAFQGLTIGCARCHDHKLDAVSQREYYALAGAFFSPRWVTNTIDMPSRNAEPLAELKRLKADLREALGSWWLDASARWPQSWTEEGRWDQALKEAGAAPGWEHPLRPWIELTKVNADPAQFAGAWTKLAKSYNEEGHRRSEANAKTFRVVADFRRSIPPGWSVDGVGFRDGPGRSGDFTVALDGSSAVGSFLPAGLWTHALSPRLNGAVRTPLLSEFAEPRLSAETAGGDFSAERVVIDNAFLSERQTYLARRDWGWSPLSFPDLAKRRVFIEWATKTSNPNFPPRVGLGGACSEAQAADSRSWLGIARAVVHQAPGAPQDELGRFRDLFDGPAPRSRDEAMARYAAWGRDSLRRWASDSATDEDVKVLQWLLDRGWLLNRSDDPAPVRVRETIAAYRRVERTVLEPRTVNGMLDADDGIDYQLYHRGDYDQPGPAVPRGYLAALDGERSAFRDRRSGRWELAERIAAPGNPLTARVYANRIWQWMFGAGLVATPDDFGHLGERPSHPELLDYLAGLLIESGWSTKRLVRELALTSAFRQGSSVSPQALDVDPANRRLHHYPLRRLEAEAARDAILAASGRLDRRLFGPPINPHRAKEDPEKRLFSGPLDGDGRRSLYIKATIMEPPRLLAAFNQPPPKIPTGKRDSTNLPAQALALLNDPFVLEQARVWGQRVVSEDRGEGGRGPSAESRLRGMFLTAFGREPSAEELALWRGLAEDCARERGVPVDRLLTSVPVWADIAHTLFNAKEFLYVR